MSADLPITDDAQRRLLSEKFGAGNILRQGVKKLTQRLDKHFCPSLVIKPILAEMYPARPMHTDTRVAETTRRIRSGNEAEAIGELIFLVMNVGQGGRGRGNYGACRREWLGRKVMEEGKMDVRRT